MNYEVVLSSRAVRDLDGIRGRPRARLLSAIERLGDDPRSRGCRKLTHSEEWRVRVGDYRIRYLIDDGTTCVIVTRIGHRRDIYDV